MTHRFSIIITVYDQADYIEACLPALLSQDYGEDYEVIVVDESSNDETQDVLKQLKDNYPRLYTTFLPKTPISKTRKKFAYYLGVKAAKYEWVIFIKIGKKPLESDVLSSVAGAFDSSSPLTLGYFGKKGIRLQSFASVDEARTHIGKAERFLRRVHDHKRLHYRFGRYDFIITKKEKAYDLLQYFEQTISWPKLMLMRTKIFFTNLF